MSTLEQKMRVMQWLSAILVGLTLILGLLYSNDLSIKKPSQAFHQDEISGGFG